VPAIFAAGMVPGMLVGLALMVPAVWLSRRHGMGLQESLLPRPPFWASLREASWGLAAPVLILGGMRAGWFTPTEAAVVAVFLRPVRWHGGLPHDQGARPVRHPA
jgi:C4-dicarboxylate transporter DctM subunit